MGGALPEPSPTILNGWLRSAVPLRPRRMEGVILAEGWTNLPAECQDEMPVTIKLSIEDERHHELRFDFEVRVDRSVKRRYEQRRQKYYQSIRLTQPPGQFIPPQPPLGLEERSSDDRSDSGSKSAAVRDVGLEISDLGTQDSGIEWSLHPGMPAEAADLNCWTEVISSSKFFS